MDNRHEVTKSQIGLRIGPRFDCSLQEFLIMGLTDHSAIRSHLAVRNYDGLIMLGYVAFAIVAIAVLYLASSGTGVAEAEFAIATVLP